MLFEASRRRRKWGLYQMLHTALSPRASQSCCVYALCLNTMQNDSIEGIYDTLKECAVISKSAGKDQRVSAGRGRHCLARRQQVSVSRARCCPVLR